MATKRNLVKSLLVVAMVVAAMAVAGAAPPDEEEAGALQARFHGRRRRRNLPSGRTTPTPTPTRPSPAPPASPVPAAPGRVPVPSPPGNLLPCDRPDVPPMMAALSAQNGTAPDCIPTPPHPRPAPPSPPQPPRYRRPQLCVCPKPPGFRVPAPVGGSGVPAPGGGGGGDSGGLGYDCVAPLSSLMTCGAFITSGAEETPTPQGDCCVALRTFLNVSSAATATGLGDGGLHCLCPFIVGGVNRVLARPVDPVRLMYLPIACGVVLPPQTLFMCFTGHPSPNVVTKFSELWVEEKSVIHG